MFRFIQACLVFIMTASNTPARAIDLGPLWDFGNPASSEQRFTAALGNAQGDDVLILKTQIARTHGLRRDFERARALLLDMALDLPMAGPEARARHALELGRTHASAAHPREQLTAQSQTLARAAFERALATARSGQLDALAIDAIHMLAFVDTAPADQLKWAQEALAVVMASKQEAAQRWEASIRNNLGMALHGLQRYGEALVQFRQALALRERAGKPEAVRVARWMVAWTLRALNRPEEALALQLQLELEAQAAGQPDHHIFDELETLYRDAGDQERSALYAARKAAVRP